MQDLHGARIIFRQVKIRNRLFAAFARESNFLARPGVGFGGFDGFCVQRLFVIFVMRQPNFEIGV
jgi:hypothetical protein